MKCHQFLIIVIFFSVIIQSYGYSRPPTVFLNVSCTYTTYISKKLDLNALSHKIFIIGLEEETFKQVEFGATRSIQKSIEQQEFSKHQNALDVTNPESLSLFLKSLYPLHSIQEDTGLDMLEDSDCLLVVPPN